MMKVENYDSAIVLRNVLDALNVKSSMPVIKKVNFLNIKHVKRRNEKEEFIFLKDVVDKDYNGFPLLDETLRADVFKFFNTNLTNYVNRILKTVYANIKIINGQPVEGIITIDNYAEDINDLIELANKKPELEKALRKIEIIYNLGELTDDIKEDLDFMCVSDEETIPLIFVSRMYAIKIDKVTIPKNSTYEKGLPVLANELEKFFPQSGLSQATLDDETIIFTDDNLILANRNYNENIAIRKFSPDEIFSYKVYDS